MQDSGIDLNTVLGGLGVATSESNHEFDFHLHKCTSIALQCCFLSAHLLGTRRDSGILEASSLIYGGLISSLGRVLLLTGC